MKILNDINLFSETAAKVIPNRGKAATLTEGEKLFDEPTLKFQAVLGKIPDFLKNRNIVFTGLSAGLTIRCVGFGSLFILAETKTEEDWSNIGYRLKTRLHHLRLHPPSQPQ